MLGLPSTMSDFRFYDAKNIAGPFFQRALNLIKLRFSYECRAYEVRQIYTHRGQMSNIYFEFDK